MSENIYRKKALESLSDAEKLDRSINVTKPRYWVFLVGIIIIFIGVFIWACTYTMEVKHQLYGIYVTNGQIGSYTCENDGIVDKIQIVPGKMVKAGDVVFEYTNQKIPSYKSPVSGLVLNVNVDPGTEVHNKQKVIQIKTFAYQNENNYGLLNLNEQDMQTSKANKIIMGTVPYNDSYLVNQGMEVEVVPIITGPNSIKDPGHMFGKITYISSQVLSIEEIEDITGSSASTAQALNDTGPVFLIYCELEKDPTSKNGFKWSKEYGKTLDLSENTTVEINFSTLKTRPIDIFFASGK